MRKQTQRGEGTSWRSPRELVAEVGSKSKQPGARVPVLTQSALLPLQTFLMGPLKKRKEVKIERGE